MGRVARYVPGLPLGKTDEESISEAVPHRVGKFLQYPSYRTVTANHRQADAPTMSCSSLLANAPTILRQRWVPHR